MKKKKRLWIGAIIVILIIIGIIMTGLLNQNKRQEKKQEYESTKALDKKIRFENGSDGDSKEQENLGEGTSEEISVEVETIEDFVEPGKGTLDISKIQGYTPAKKTVPKGKKKKDSSKSVNISLSDENLVVNSIGGYTGNYLEDGSDEPITNVAALVITNKSKEMLQVGDITFQVNEKETAMFRITNLLPGSSVLVLEANKREYSKEDDYFYGEVANAYLNYTSLMEDAFEIIKDDGKLTLKNKTNNTYKKVYVYYKYAQMGGAYMGGITYRVPFENIEAKGSVESIANHFSVNTSRIIDVQIVEN